MGKKSKPPPPPDTTKAAEQTAASNAAATQAQTIANRPNQTDVYGNTSKWTRDRYGNWTQTQALSGTNQAMLDQQNAMKSGLMGQASASLKNPLDLSGLPEYTNLDPSKLQGVDTNIGAGTGPMGKLQENYGPMGQLSGAGQFNMDPMGNSKAIQDATMGLIAPQREMARNSEIQRLKNQGLTEDSPAFQRAVTRLDQGDSDAQLRALLAGQQEYGNQFNRGLQQNQSNFGQNLNAADFANRSQGQLFGQDMSRAGLASSNQNQQFGQNEAQQRLAMALRGQQWGEQTDQLAGNSAQRAQMLNEQSMVRQQPLNDLEQLMQAQAINNPAFGQFSQAGNAGGTDYYGAMNDAYKTQVGATNAANANKSNMTSGLMGLAGTALTVF